MHNIAVDREWSIVGKMFKLQGLLLNVLPKYCRLFIEHCHDFMVSLACNH